MSQYADLFALASFFACAYFRLAAKLCWHSGYDLRNQLELFGANEAQTSANQTAIQFEAMQLLCW